MSAITSTVIFDLNEFYVMLTTEHNLLANSSVSCCFWHTSTFIALEMLWRRTVQTHNLINYSVRILVLLHSCVSASRAIHIFHICFCCYADGLQVYELNHTGGLSENVRISKLPGWKRKPCFSGRKPVLRRCQLKL